MAKTLDREIDLTEGRFFKKATDIVEQREHNLFGFDFLEKKEKFPWNKAYKKADGTFTNTQTISSERDLNQKNFEDAHWNYLGFKYYGGIEQPFFTGTKEERNFHKLALEEDYFYEMEGAICCNCGKGITILDLDSKKDAICSYLPPLCRNCLEKVSSEGEHLFRRYKETFKAHNKMTQFTVSLERP